MMTAVLGVLAFLFLALVVAVVVLARQVREAVKYLEEQDAQVAAMRACGIYAVVCHTNGASYLGSTKVNFHNRWGQHLTSLSQGRHSNPRLQQDWTAYGPDAFTFVVLEVIGDGHDIEARERELLRHRAMHLLPIRNYNVNHSRVYPVPSTPEHAMPDARPQQSGRRIKRVRKTAEECESGNAFFRELGYTEEEIAAFNEDRVIIIEKPTNSAME